MPAQNLETLVSLCKRRGFIFQSGELYGGLQGVYDFGPLGIELKNNLKRSWWKSMVYDRDDIEGLDASILSHKHIFKYSGHEDTFADMMVDCKQCKKRWRADHLQDNRCESCGSKDLTEPRAFNMMFKTQVGPVIDETSFAFLRPETAQGIFTNFKNVIDSTPSKLPFGIAQIGKAFRNEITPKNFIFRVREFEQMELEYFVRPGEDEQWHNYWVEQRYNWWLEQGLSSNRLEKMYQKPEDLSHYAKATVDLLYHFPHGTEELEGIANRTDFDLGSHTKAQLDFSLYAKVKTNADSTEKLAIQDLHLNKAIIPFVIEPSAGVERGILAILSEAYHEEDLGEGKKRTVLKIKPHLAPIKAAILPLAKNNSHIMETARAVVAQIRKLGLGRIVFEETGNIGKGYRRHDEIGTPLCITIDFDTIGENSEKPEYQNTVTIRHRDSMNQERIAIKELNSFLLDYYAH